MGASNYLALRISGHDGAERWRSTAGGGWTGSSYAGVYVEDSACAIAVDNDGGVVIAGNTEGALFESTGGEKPALDRNPYMSKEGCVLKLIRQKQKNVRL